MLQKNKSLLILLVATIMIMNVLMVSLLVYILYTSHQKKEIEIQKHVGNLALLLDKSVSNSTNEINLSLHTIQTYVENQRAKNNQINDEDIKNLIQKQENWIGSVVRIEITDEKGKVLLSDQELEGKTLNYANYDFFTEAQQTNIDRLFVSKLVKNPNGEGWVHLFARPYRQSNGHFAGMVIATLPTNYFDKLIHEINVGSKGVVIVQDDDMRIIARHPKLQTIQGQVGSVGGPPEMKHFIDSNIRSNTFYAEKTLDQIPRLGAFRQLNNMPIFVVVAFAQEDYLAEWYQDILRFIVLGLLFFAVSLVTGWLLWHQIKANMLTNRRSNVLLHNAQDGIHILDRDGKLIEASDSFFQMIASTAQQALGKKFTYWDNGYNKKELQELHEKGVSTPTGIRFETCYMNAEGQCYPVEVSSVLVQLDQEEVFFCSARDISERKKAEENLRIAATAFDSQIGMLITDPHLVILRTNRAFTDITGYSEEELLGYTPKLLQSGLHDKKFYAMMWDQIRTVGSWKGEIWNKRKNGELYPQYILIAGVRNEKEQITHYVASITDISAYKASEEKIRLLAFYDSLTKLPNRNLFLQRLESNIQEAESKNYVGALLFINLDNFKVLNDIEGHEAGDRLLQQVAIRLLDTVEANHMIARFANDEFVVLLNLLGASETEAINYAEKTAKHILQALIQPYFFTNSEYRSSASIGISLFGLEKNENVQDPIKRADMAVVEAKKKGGNLYQFFDKHIQSLIHERAEIDAGLRQALEKNQLQLYYQPQVNALGQMIGVEALLRWNHPIKGIIPPASFISIAEENGLLISLGLWALKTACQQLSKWAQANQVEQITIAVNVSATQFARDEFVQDVLDILQETQAPAHLLKLELTESALVMSIDEVIEKMMILKGYGVSFSLDDFGTGYSSLTYLQRIPIDQLKIDQGFVRNMENNINDTEIAKMIIVLAKTLGVSVLAEGVENKEQLNILQQHGCYDYQGYLFGKPMPIDQLESYIVKQRASH